MEYPILEIIIYVSICVTVGFIVGVVVGFIGVATSKIIYRG